MFGKVSRRRPRRASRALAAVAGLALIAAWAGGCGREAASGRASAGPEGDGAPSSADVAGARELTLFLPYPGKVDDPTKNAELFVWKTVVQEEAGRLIAPAGMGLEIEELREGDPPSRQAEQIRAAIGRGSAAMIVVAADPKAVAPALAEARDRGIPAVLLGRPVAVEGKPLPFVHYGPFEDAARRVVEATRLVAEDRAPAGANSKALLVVNRTTDDHSGRRVAALKKALDDAKVPLAQTIRFDEYPEAAQKAIVAALKSDPSIGIVLVEEDQGIGGVSLADDEIGRDHPFTAGGFVYDVKQHRNLVKFGECAALIDRKVREMATRAVRAAVALAEGRPFPEADLEVKPEVIRLDDPVAAGRRWAASAASRKDPRPRN